jgi:hypothetical protein
VDTISADQDVCSGLRTVGEAVRPRYPRPLPRMRGRDGPVYWKADNLPGFIGIAVGALADPQYPAPSRYIFEQSKHRWAQIDGVAEHFQQSSATKNAE